MNHREALPPGTVLANEYQIEDVLGAGGFGITYRALDLALRKPVAIKEYFPKMFAMREMASTVRSRNDASEEQYREGLQRFVREARTLAQFKHDNIVRVNRTFPLHNTAYMVLEYVEGRDMDNWLKELAAPPSQERIDELVRPLLDALRIIHDNNVLHRDIKPANIYVRAMRDEPVLLDFGSARAVMTEHSASTAAIVSRFYSPWECYQTNTKNQGPPTDIYSLAATLHRSVTGEPPVEAPNRVGEDDYIPLAEQPALRARYRESFLRGVDAGLAVFARERPQSIAAWAPLLMPVDRTVEIAAPRLPPQRPPPPPPIEPTAAQVDDRAKPLPGRQGSRNTGYAMLAMALVLAAGGGAGYLWLSQQQDSAAPSPTPNTIPVDAPPRQVGTAPTKEAGPPAVVAAAPNSTSKPAVEAPPPAPVPSLLPVTPPQPPAATTAAVVTPPPPTIPKRALPTLLRPGPEGIADRLTAIAVGGTSGIVAATAVSGKDKGRLWVWDTADDASGIPKAYALSFNAQAVAVHAAGGASLAAAGGYSDTAEIIDLKTDKTRRVPVIAGSSQGRAAVRGLTFSPDGATLVVVSRTGVSIVDVSSGKQLDRLEGSAAALSDNGEWIATGTERNDEKMLVQVYRRGESTPKPVQSFAAHAQTINALAFSPDNRRLVSGSADGTVGVFDLRSGEARFLSDPGHSDSVLAIAVSKDGRRFASVGGSVVVLWDAQTLTRVTTFPSHSGLIKGAAFLPDGRQLAVLTDDGGVKLWSIDAELSSTGPSR